MAQLLITGGAGFIGSHSCLVLLEAGHNLVVLDNFDNSSPESLKRVLELAGPSAAGRLRVVEGDTSLTPVDLGSYSSRVTFMAGNACVAAADKVRARLFAAAAKKLGVEEAALRAAEGFICVQYQPEKRMSFVDAVWLAEESGPLVEAGSYTPPKIGNRFRRQSVGPSPAYSFTAQVAEVEVDEETGILKVERIWVAHDCGRALNRTIVEGQMEGCVYMGVGEAVYEEQVYRKGGILRAPSILEYKIPTLHETPEIHSIIVESHEEGGPLRRQRGGRGTTALHRTGHRGGAAGCHRPLVAGTSLYP